MKAEDTKELYRKIDRISGIGRGFQAAVVLTTAAKLDLFTVVDRKGPLTPEQAAGELGLDGRAADIFLHALAGMELLEKRDDGTFANSELSEELLVAGRPFYQGDILRHNAHLAERWVQLPEVLRTGKPAEGPRSTENSEMRRAFILGMSNIARLSAGKMADALDISGARRMLDLGGGPGTYAITFCERNTDMEAVVFDLPEVIEDITRDQVKKAGLGERIGFMGGDYLEDDFGSGYDLVMVSNIIHSLGPDGIRTILRKAASAMVQGGRLLLKDFLQDEDRVNPPFSSMFAVNMLVGTSEGGCYTVEQSRGFLRETGFEPGELIDISPQARILLGTRS